MGRKRLSIAFLVLQAIVSRPATSHASFKISAPEVPNCVYIGLDGFEPSSFRHDAHQPIRNPFRFPDDVERGMIIDAIQRTKPPLRELREFREYRIERRDTIEIFEPPKRPAR